MRLLLATLLLTVLAACAPAAEPTFQRDGEDVRITVRANETLYDTTLSIVNAETNDERCTTLSDTDLACALGTIPEGENTSVLATSPGNLSCIAFAFLEPDAVGSYRPYPCSTD